VNKVQNNTQHLRWNELKGRAVVDITSAERVGSIEDFVLDAQTYQIVGLRFKKSLFNAAKNVPLSAIKGVGTDAITLRLEDSQQPDANEEQAFEALPTLSQLIGNGVVTENGKLVGSIINARISLAPLRITGYEVSKGGIFSKTHSFELTSEVSYGEKLVVIPDNLLDTFAPVA
jgi:uncharacterized protein YrrD